MSAVGLTYPRENLDKYIKAVSLFFQRTREVARIQKYGR